MHLKPHKLWRSEEYTVEDDGDDNNENVVQILCEIVSALRIPSVDTDSESDPYVSVYMKGKEVHRTKHLDDQKNPVWSLETGSLFLLKIHKDKIDLENEMVSFVIWDWDRMSKDEKLGEVEIAVQEIL